MASVVFVQGFLPCSERAFVQGYLPCPYEKGLSSLSLSPEIGSHSLWMCEIEFCLFAVIGFLNCDRNNFTFESLKDIFATLALLFLIS